MRNLTGVEPRLLGTFKACQLANVAKETRLQKYESAFVVNGARPDPDGALVSAGAEMKWLSGFSLAATFEGEFSGNVTSYAGKGVARYTW